MREPKRLKSIFLENASFLLGCCCSYSAPYSWLPVFQECLHLIRRVCVEEATGTELTNKLTEHLKEILSDNKVRATVLPLSQTSKR